MEKDRLIVAVSGLGGVGKTQLIRKFIDQNRQIYRNLIWINSKDSETIEEEFRRLAKIMELKQCMELDFVSLIEEVLKKLSSSRTLFVFDNVDNEENAKFIRKMGTPGVTPHIIITSRIQEWSESIESLKLSVFSVEDAIEYVSQELSCDTEANIRRLVETLQSIPIALRQATAHISYHRKQESFTIDDFLMAFSISKEQILKSNFFQKDFLNQYDQTTFATWKTTINAINERKPEGGLALRILHIIAYFDPDHIPRDVFYNLNSRCSEHKVDKNRVKSAVRLLINYSMIDSSDQQSMLSIHRLVQDVLKIDLEKDSSLENETLRDCLHILSESIGNKTFQQCNEHGISVSLSAFKFDNLVREFNKFPIVILLNLCKFRNYFRAVSYGLKILQPFTTILGEDHLETLNTELVVAYSYKKLGKASDALKMYQEAFEPLKIILREDHPKILACMSKIANLYNKLGRYSNALQMFENVLAKQKMILVQDHSDTLTSQFYIASLYNQLGKSSDALRMFQEVLEKQKIILAEDHLDALKIKFGIAISYNKLAKASDALLIYEEVFEKLKIILGDDHPNTLRCMFNIASSYNQLGKCSDALRMFKEVFEKHKTILGEDHPDTLKIKASIDNLYNSMRCQMR